MAFWLCLGAEHRVRNMVEQAVFALILQSLSYPAGADPRDGNNADKLFVACVLQCFCYCLGSQH